ncbi:hypothetical protein F383_31724 [Gossypium arboreum]|uniref:Uncharacterized protein n=1 Tax=Gossypium arboreum TaxID=29729 RepID=A0A0B0PJH9_GOSAR|nr:hypothetical protein F383_31724 [Gossypium arboreum]
MLSSLEERPFSLEVCMAWSKEDCDMKTGSVVKLRRA